MKQAASGATYLAGAVVSVALLVTLLAYWPTLHGDFVFDDQPNILESPGVHWTNVSWANLRGLIETTRVPRRVVANLSFAMNHLLDGLDPKGYHVVNILIHLATGAALAMLSLVYLRPMASGFWHAGELGLAAAVPAALFLVHPLNTQAVSYVVQRMTSMAALFCLLSLLSYIVGRRRAVMGQAGPWFVGAVLLWLLALGSKETALALPLVVLTYEACFHRTFWRDRFAAGASAGRRHRVRVPAIMTIAATVGLGAVAVALYAGGNPLSLGPLPGREFTGLERVLTQSRVQFLYMGLFFWPSPARLNLDHDFTVSRCLLDPPTTVLAVLLWLALAAGAVVLAVRRPRYGFPALAYFEFHLIESAPINLELVFEHRMYLPMTMIALFGSVGLARLPRRGRTLAVVLGLACAAPLAGATYVRNQTWGDSVALLHDTARKSPNKFRPQFNLGTVLGKRGRASEALAPLRRAAALNPASSEAHNQLGNALLLIGRSDEALVEYRRAVELNSRNAEAVYNLASLLEQQGEVEEAVQYYRRFVSVAPPGLADRLRAVRIRLRRLRGS